MPWLDLLRQNVPEQPFSELNPPDSFGQALKRCFQGSRGMESFKHGQASWLWISGIVLLAASMLISIIGSIGLKVFYPDFGTRLGIIVMPMAWVLICMPMHLLVQIVGGRRGLEAANIFLTASLSAFGFFIFFPIALLFLPLIPESPELGALSLFCLLLAIGYSSILTQKGLVHLSGVREEFASLKASGMATIAFFFAFGVWYWLLGDLASWDPTFFLS